MPMPMDVLPLAGVTESIQNWAAEWGGVLSIVFMAVERPRCTGCAARNSARSR